MTKIKLYNCTLVGTQRMEVTQFEIECNEDMNLVVDDSILEQVLYFVFESSAIDGQGAIRFKLNEAVYPYNQMEVGQKYIVYVTDSEVTHIERYSPLSKEHWTKCLDCLKQNQDSVPELSGAENIQIHVKKDNND